MAWTYDATALTETTVAGRVNIVRFLIGDTITTDQQLQDEEITYLLTKHTDLPYYAAMDAIRALIAKYARDVDAWMGHTRIERAQRIRHYRQLLEELESNYTAITISIFAGGQSISGKSDLDADTDAVHPTFKVGMDDYSRATGDDD